MSAANSDDLPRRIGRYEVCRRLGRGAMGDVLLARDPVLERPVAIKYLRPDLSLTAAQVASLRQRLVQEARACARINHPHLVTLHDAGQSPDLGPYIVFEYVEGPTLSQRLQRGPLKSEEVARLAVELGPALDDVHRVSVVHRDVKPDNIMLTPTGAKLTDFGIARLPDSTLTLPGGLLGTPAYSAPETVENSAFGPLSDQFSLAATLYEALSGRRAFPGDDAVAVAALVRTSEPPPVAAVCGVALTADTVLAQGLAKNPAARFASCEELGRALERCLVQPAPHQRPTLPDLHHQQLRLKSARRWPALALTALLACVGTLGVLRLRGELPRLVVSSAGEPRRPSAAELERAKLEEQEDLHPVGWLRTRSRRSLEHSNDDPDGDDAQ